jgi:hypothetical protein
MVEQIIFDILWWIYVEKVFTLTVYCEISIESKRIGRLSSHFVDLFLVPTHRMQVNTFYGTTMGVLLSQLSTIYLLPLINVILCHISEPMLIG